MRVLFDFFINIARWAWHLFCYAVQMKKRLLSTAFCLYFGIVKLEFRFQFADHRHRVSD